VCEILTVRSGVWVRVRVIRATGEMRDVRENAEE
jgi:hypothetical protein